VNFLSFGQIVFANGGNDTEKSGNMECGNRVTASICIITDDALHN